MSPDRVTGGVTGSGLVREAARGHHRRVARLVLLHRPNSPRTIGIGVTEQVSTGDRVRVVLAEDHPIYRRGLLRALEAHEQLEVVGEARDGRQALALIRGKRPDVAVLDVRMPEIDGLGVLGILQSEEVATRVVLVSAFVDGAIVHQALVAGASGYVAKDADEQTVCAAVLAAHRGDTAISPDLQAGVVDHVRRRAEAEAGLSAREQQILERLARGRSVPDIGRELHLSPDTVKTYARRLYEKLAVRNAAEAVAEGMRRGLLD